MQLQRQSLTGLRTKKVPTTFRSCGLKPVCAVSSAVEERVHNAITEVLASIPGSDSKRVSLESANDSLQKLKDLGAELQIDRANEAYMLGAWDGLLTTDQRMFDGDVTTLGRMTFNSFKPADLQVDTAKIHSEGGLQQTGLPPLFRGKYDGIEKAHVIFTHYRIIDPDNPDSTDLIACQAAVAEYEVLPGEGGEPPRRVNVAFRSLKVWPAPSVKANPKAFARWKELLGPHNPNMTSEGELSVAFPPKGPASFIDIKLMTQQYSLHVGGMGSNLIMKRYVPPAGSLGDQLVKSATQTA